ncbi:telomere length regulation protein-domain-containing protein [Phlyctochytrium arcticum]|nr:telomere length regulation protein-domain-containing protein [Phlyctochytrium arcticum]
MAKECCCDLADGTRFESSSARQSLFDSLKKWQDAINNSKQVADARALLQDILSLIITEPPHKNGHTHDFPTLSEPGSFFSSYLACAECRLSFRSVFIKHHLERHYRFLIKSVGPKWLPLLSEDDQRALFFKQFLSEDRKIPNVPMAANPEGVIDGRVIAIKVLIESVNTSISLYNRNFVLQLLRTLLDGPAICQYLQILSESDESETFLSGRINDFFPSLFFLPDKISNLMEVDEIPSFFRHRNFFRTISRHLAKFLQTSNSNSAIIAPLAQAASQMVRLGHAEQLTEECIACRDSGRPGPFSDLLMYMGMYEAERMLLYMLNHMVREFQSGLGTWGHVTSQTSTILDLKRIASREEIQDLFCSRVLINTILMTDTSRLLVTLLAKLPSDNALHLAKCVAIVMRAFTDRNMILYGAFDLKLHYARFILLSVPFLTADDLMSSDLSNSFINGVGSYLDSDDSNSRMLGMIVGEKLSGVMGGSVNLDFEIPDSPMTRELRMYSEKWEDSKVLSAGNDVAGSQGLSRGANHAIEGPESHAPCEEDPDEVVEFRDTLLDNEDSDDGLEPYKLPEETNTSSDGKKPFKPKFIRDALKALQEQDDPDKISISLETLPRFIERASELEIAGLAESLVSVLIHLQDSYELPNFTELRINAISALLVHSPRIVYQQLLNSFFGRNLAIQQRVDILNSLGLGALRLSNHDVAGNNGKMPKIVDAVGMARKRPTTSPNSFGPLAASFLLPLLSRAHEIRLLTLGVTLEVLLLTRILMTAGTILLCARNTIDARRLARQFYSYLLSFKSEQYARQDRVVKAVLFGLHTIISVLPRSILIDEFNSGNQDLLEIHSWLSGLVNMDGNIDNARYAIAIQSELAQILDSQHKYIV